MDYGDNVSDVRDIIRTTIVALPGKIVGVLADSKLAMNVVSVREQLSSSDPLGYSGHLLQVMNRNGTYGEVQINTPQMIYAKESNAKSILGDSLFNRIRKESRMEPGLGHRYYEEYRAFKIDDISRKREIDKTVERLL